MFATLGTGQPCRSRVRKKAQNWQLQYSDSGTREGKAEKSAIPWNSRKLSNSLGGKADELETAEQSILDLH